MLSDDLIVEDVCNDSVEIQCLTEKCQVKSQSRCQVEHSKQLRWTLFTSHFTNVKSEDFFNFRDVFDMSLSKSALWQPEVLHLRLICQPCKTETVNQLIESVRRTTSGRSYVSISSQIY